MAYKFPWTNYHELNLDWILDTVKELFSKTEQNNAVVEQYDGRLTEVELTADNAQTAAEQAQQNSTAALDLAQGAQTTATQAQQAAAQAQQAAGQAQQAAGQAMEAAATAQQTATQAQQTSQNFDGRIRQAEDNAASALQAAQAFDEQVQGAITAANNANEAATAALTTSAETARELAAQRDTLEDIIENAAQSLEVDLSTKADIIINTAEGEIASFNDGADDMKIKSLIVNIEPVQSGSGDPSPDNVRPISGWTGLNLTRNGENYISLEQGTFNTTGEESTSTTRVRSQFIPIDYNNMRYYFDTDGWDFRNAFLYDAKKVFLTTKTGLYKSDGKYFFNNLVPEAAYFRAVFSKVDRDESCTPSDYYAMLELNQAPTKYVPYQGETISVNWGDEAGTVYGGTLDVISGKLVVNRAYKKFDQSERSSFAIYNYTPIWRCNWNQSPQIVKAPETIQSINIMSSVFKPVSEVNRGNALTCFVNASRMLAFDISDANISTAQEAFDYLISINTDVVYELATPVEYQLTPQQVKTLYQYNNIWSDAGSVDVEYPADTKTYIDNKFAELQALILEH